MCVRGVCERCVRGVCDKCMLTVAGVELALQRAVGRAEALQVLLQGLQLLAQAGPVRREQVVLLHHLTDALQQLSHTNERERGTGDERREREREREREERGGKAELEVLKGVKAFLNQHGKSYFRGRQAC